MSGGTAQPSAPASTFLAYAVSLHYMHYNYARPQQTLTRDNGGYKTTPAMAAGVTNRVWTHRGIAALLD